MRSLFKATILGCLAAVLGFLIGGIINHKKSVSWERE